jgi:hypothetical protein
VVEVVPPICALSLSRAGVLLEAGARPPPPLECHGRGVLRQSGRRDGLHLQGLQGDHAQPAIALGGQQGSEAVPHPVSMEGGPREPRLQQRSPPLLF